MSILPRVEIVNTKRTRVCRWCRETIEEDIQSVCLRNILFTKIHHLHFHVECWNEMVLEGIRRFDEDKLGQDMDGSGV